MYILKFPDIDCDKPDMLFEELVEGCHTLCPMGNILPCPFNDKNCNTITKEDWMNIFQEVKEK